MKRYVDGKYVEISETEIAEFQEQAAIAEAQEKSRPLTEAEVSRMLITAQINILTVDDFTALRMKQFYPDWALDTSYTTAAGRPMGFKVQYDNSLWKLRQEHTSQIGWEPGKVASLWEQIDEAHAGTIEDPVPYNENMTLESGKYYSQGGQTYLCSRDTGYPVYHSLEVLVGIYVEKV